MKWKMENLIFNILNSYMCVYINRKFNIFRYYRILILIFNYTRSLVILLKFIFYGVFYVIFYAI